MSRRPSILLAALSTAAFALPAGAAPTLPAPSRYGTVKGFQVLGHAPLDERGANSPVAVAGRCVYVGDRYDQHGVAIVDVADPRRPTVVGSIPPVVNLTQRELRADAGLGLLVVMSYTLRTGALGNKVTIYDIRDCARPQLLSTYDMGPRSPHEFFLWKDRTRPGRALVYLANTLFSPDLEVVDITDPRAPRLVAAYDLGVDIATSPATVANSGSGYLHSISVSDDGTRAYLSTWDYGMYVADTSMLAQGLPAAVVRPLGPPVAYSGNVHGAVKVPGRPYAVLVEEAYADAGAGCPFGWLRMADVGDETTPALVLGGQFKLRENDCAAARALNGTFTSHNQTVFPNVALVPWYGGGLRAVDISSPRAPFETGAFVPRPAFVPDRRDNRLFFAGSTVDRWTGAMWSYPVVQNGLVYVVDIDLGLFVLRYTGRHAAEVARAGFVEGNSAPSRYSTKDPVVRRPAFASGPPTVVRSPFADLPLPARARSPYGFFCVGG